MTIHDPHRYTVPCVVMRGGTTRGFFFQPKDLPEEGAVRDQLFLDVVAGQDLRQADGLGGNNMLLNKVVSVWASARPDADVECTFGVLTPGSARVKYGSNCGNLVSAAALFALEEDLHSGLGGTVRLFNPQSGTRVDARLMGMPEFHDRARRVKSMGMAMNGLPIELAFIDPTSTIGRGLLPTGRAVDHLSLGAGAEIAVSIVDSGTVYVFVSAADLGIDCATMPMSASRQAEILEIAEHLRDQAAMLCGLTSEPGAARRLTPAVPKVSIVSPSRDYALGGDGLAIEATDTDALARIVSSQNFHTAYAVTGMLATIAAAVVPGSVVNTLVGEAAAASPLNLKIGHPSGVIEARQDWHMEAGAVVIDRAYLIRTARRLMTGVAYVSRLAAMSSTDFRTTKIWTSAPMRNGSPAPEVPVHRVSAR